MAPCSCSVQGSFSWRFFTGAVVHWPAECLVVLRVRPVRVLSRRDVPRSGGLQQGRPNSRRHFYGDEAIGGEEVILSALIDHAQVALSLGRLAGQYDVNLVALERRLAARVLDADREAGRTCSRPRRSNLTRIAGRDRNYVPASSSCVCASDPGA